MTASPAVSPMKVHAMRFYKEHRPTKVTDQYVFVTAVTDEIVIYAVGDGRLVTVPRKHFTETIEYAPTGGEFSFPQRSKGPRFVLQELEIEAE